MSICRTRFKDVILMSVGVQFFLIFICSFLLVNVNLLHPVTWIKESFSILCSPLMLFTVVHGYFKLKPFIGESKYIPSRFAKLIKSFAYETSIFLLTLIIGFLTSELYIRLLNPDFKHFTIKSDEKTFLNEKFAFLLLNGAFVRCYFHFKRRDTEQNIYCPVVHQSKFLQVRRQVIVVIKASLSKSLLPTFYFVGFYIAFGGMSCRLLTRVFGLHTAETSLLESTAALFNPKQLIFSWILTCMIWSNMELLTKVIEIYVTQPMQFPVEVGASLTLADALSHSKFRITQQLAAQDLFALADNSNGVRRKQVYALSNHGGHPHNWKLLVQSSLEVINKLSEELRLSIESSSKNKSALNSNPNQGMFQFYESKKLARQFNDFSGVRSLATSPVKYEPAPIDKQPDYLNLAKQKLMGNRVVFFFFGEASGAKLNFLLNQNSQTVGWIVQGVSAIVIRSIKEDSYGVVQQDIKQIIKAFIKLKLMLDKVGAVSNIAKDRNFISLKMAIRRSLYRITSEFSRFFDDLLLDSDDVRALSSFVCLKEL